MTKNHRNSLSPRDMRRLGDWVLANHEAVDRDGLTRFEAVARASEQLTSSLKQAFVLGQNDLTAAYDSVEIEWRPRHAETADASRDEEIAEMANVLAAVCREFATDRLRALGERASWKQTAKAMSAIHARLSPPNEGETL